MPETNDKPAADEGFLLSKTSYIRLPTINNQTSAELLW